MRILFIYSDVVMSMMSFCPAIHVLSAVLKREGCDVHLLHINNKNGIRYDKETIIKLSGGYDLFAFTATSHDYKYANEIAGWLKETYPSVLRILGGSHATTQPEDFGSSYFDIFCVGEGEEPMVDLINVMREGGDWTKIPNFVTKSGVNPTRGFLRDLDTLPFWDFDITDTETILESRKGYFSISFSRGCPYQCTFCINPLYQKIDMKVGDRMVDYIRRRSPANVITELETLVDKYRIKYFVIDDDLLLVNKKWTREFTVGYRDRIYKPFGVGYVISARATGLDENTVSLLAESGCNEVRVGIETGNEKLRNGFLRKNISNEALINAFKTLRDHGVRSLGFVIVGLPDETWTTYFDTIRLLLKLKPDLVRINFLYPYKHTEIYNICKERGLFKEGFSELDNRETGSPLKLPNVTDKALFLFRFLFPWYINTLLHRNSFDYISAISTFSQYDIGELEGALPSIKEKDKELSSGYGKPHYRYYSGNESYFELYDNIKDAI